MLQHFGTAPSTRVSLLDENLILAEIEGFLNKKLANNVQKDGVMAMAGARRRKTRSFPVLVAFGIAAVVALVPIGLKRGYSAGKASHQAMGEASRGALND